MGQQGVTYDEHWCFAIGIASRFMCSVIAFALHAMFLLIGVEKEPDPGATTALIDEHNAWIENAKASRHLLKRRSLKSHRRNHRVDVDL